MRTYIKAYVSLNFGQIPPLTTELAALERLKNRCHHVISVDIDPIFFKLAGNKDMNNIMNEFEFRPDRTIDYGFSCPWASKKYPYRPYNGENGVSTFSLWFLIGSFWYFHVTRTSIKAWMSSNFLKWDLTLAHWTQVSDRCPLGYLFKFYMLCKFKFDMLCKLVYPVRSFICCIYFALHNIADNISLYIYIELQHCSIFLHLQSQICIALISLLVLPICCITLSPCICCLFVAYLHRITIRITLKWGLMLPKSHRLLSCISPQ